MDDKGKQLEEPILAKARKARVLRIQDQLDRSSEPLIGEYCCLLYYILYYILLSAPCGLRELWFFFC